MKQEDKQLLLKDLCARLPLGVKIELTWWVMGEGTYINTTLEPDHIEQLLNEEDEICIKPYLRPMSSMTQEEKKEYNSFFGDIEPYDCDLSAYPIEYKYVYEWDIKNYIDFLNSIHVDYRGLIPKGLAIEVTKENNPYAEINL